MKKKVYKKGGDINQARYGTNINLPDMKKRLMQAATRRMQDGGKMNPTKDENVIRQAKRRRGPIAEAISTTPNDSKIWKELSSMSDEELMKAAKYTDKFKKTAVDNISLLGEPPRALAKHTSNIHLGDNIAHLLKLRNYGVGYSKGAGYLNQKKKGGAISKPSYKNGGELAAVLQGLAPVIGAIPGLQIPGAAMGAFGAFAGMANTQEPKQIPLTQMKGGGKIGSGFKQYSAPTHEQGGQLIDAIGNPSGKTPVAEIEKAENSYDGYVYSDHLINPDTGRPFAKDAAMINKKIKGKDDISVNSYKAQMKALKDKNTAVREQQEIIETGGAVPEARMGYNFGFPEDPSPAIVGGISNAALAAQNLGSQALINTALGKAATGGSTTGYTGSDPFLATAGNAYRAVNDVNTLGQGAATGMQSVASNLGAGASKAVGSELTSGISPTTAGRTLNLNHPALALKAAALGKSAYDALQPAEQEKLQRANFSAGDQAYQGLATSISPMLGEINMGAEKAVQDISNQAGSLASRNTRVASIFSRAGKDSAFAQMQQQDMNNRLKMAQGQREDMKAMSDQGEMIRQQDTQSRNDANRRLASRKFFTDLSQVGSSLNQVQYARDAMKNQNENVKQYIQYGISVLANKYPDFKPGDDLYDKLLSGNYTPEDLVKFSGMVSK